MDNENLRIEALNVAAKLAMSSNLRSNNVLEQAREFYGFLSGDKGAPIPTGTYTVNISTPLDSSLMGRGKLTVTGPITFKASE